ncbi:unnamed protein product [Chrysoparadoxa australica]
MSFLTWLSFALFSAAALAQDFGFPGGNQPRKEAITAEVPFIGCSTCKLAAQSMHQAVESMRHPRLGIHEDDIEKLVLETCLPAAPAGTWLKQYDIVLADKKLTLELRDGIGSCSEECETIAKSCGRLIDDLDMEELVVALWRGKKSPEELESFVCTELSSRCSSPDPAFDSTRTDYPPFRWEAMSESELQMEELMNQMKELGLEGSVMGMGAGDEF